MDINPRYTLVGILVVILLFALGFWVSWLWRGDSSEKTAHYSIYFSKQSLSGLQTDSIVTMRGIKVGNVQSVAIDPNKIERVRVSILLKDGTPVKEDTRAVINRNLLTGLAAIDLIGSTQSSKPLVIVTGGENFPVIEEGQTGLEQVQQSVPELVGKAGVVLDKMSQLLSDQNIAHVSATLDNIEQGSIAVADIGKLIDAADRSFGGLSDLLKETKGKVSPVLGDFAATLKEIRTVATALSSELSQVLRSAKATSDKLREPRSSILGLPSGKLGPGEQQGK